MNPTVKIVLIGPESSGKSTLTEQLAAHFKAPFVPEFARHYLERKKVPGYELDDLERIAQEQVKLVQEAIRQKPKLLFCDTDLITLHIWSLDKFNRAIPFVEENLEKHKGDFYLLCKPDLPWQLDPLREDSNRRDVLYDWNERVLTSIQAKYAIVQGQGSYRLEAALSALKKFLKVKTS